MDVAENAPPAWEKPCAGRTLASQCSPRGSGQFRERGGARGLSQRLGVFLHCDYRFARHRSLLHVCFLRGEKDKQMATISSVSVRGRKTVKTGANRGTLTRDLFFTAPSSVCLSLFLSDAARVWAWLFGAGSHSCDSFSKADDKLNIIATDFSFDSLVRKKRFRLGSQN